MAGARTFVVRVLADSKEAIAGLKKVGSESKKLGDDLDKGLGASLKNLLPSFRTVAAVGATAFVGAAAAGYKLVQAGSTLSESMSKVNAVFGESASTIQEFSKTTAASLGITRQQTLEAAGTFGNLIQAFGIARSDAATMSEQLVRLAADLASFNNVPIEDVFTALRSGLSGETEPLKRFGVALNDTRLKQEALNMGLYDGKGALDITAKTQAAYALILKDTALAQGDVERTSGGFANQMRFLKASLSDAGAELGLVLLPYAEKFVRFINDHIIPGIKAFSQNLGKEGFGVSVVFAIAAMGDFGTKMINTLESMSIAVLTFIRDLASLGEKLGMVATLVGGLTKNPMLAIKGATIGMGLGELETQIDKRLENIGGDFDKLRDRVTKAQNKMAQFIPGSKFEQQVGDFRGEMGKAKETVVDFDNTIGSGSKTVKKAKDVLKEYTEAMKSAGRAQDSFNASIKSTDKAQRSLTEANTNLATAQEKFRQAVAGYGADSQQAKDAQRELDAAQRGVERAGYRVEEAVFAIADAERELAEVRGAPGATAQDVREAEIALAEAKLSLSDATDDQVRSTQDLSQAQLVLNEVVYGALPGSALYEELSRAVADAEQRRADAHDAVTEALKRQQEAQEALFEAVKNTQGFKGKPGFVATVPNPVGAATADISQSLLDYMNAGLDRLRSGSDINVVINAGIGTSGVQVGQELNDYLSQYYRLNGGSFDRYGNIGVV